MKSEHSRGLWLAALAVLCFSTAPVVLMWTDPLTAFEKAAWRMAIAALVVFGLAWSRGALPRFKRQDLSRFLFFGFVTALHFLTFVASLSFTTIAHAVTITYTAPLFVSLFSALVLREHFERRKYVAMFVVILGIAVLVGFEPALTREMLIGDGLALLAAISFGVYSVVGRAQRSVYPLFTYTFGVYSVAALWLIPSAALTFCPSGYGLRQVLALLWVSVVPLALGHTLYNAALRRTHATYANIIATQEVTGGVVLGMLLLGQVPTANSIVGIAITLVGVALVLV